MTNYLLIAVIFAALVALVAYRDVLGKHWGKALAAIIFAVGVLMGRRTRKPEEPPSPAPNPLIGDDHHDKLDVLTRPHDSDLSNDDLATALDELFGDRE